MRTSRVAVRAEQTVPTSVPAKERLQQGRTQRNSVSRSKLGELNPTKRGFNSIELLLGATEQRVPRLLHIKYARMSASPFAFFRGAVAIMAADLATHPHTRLTVQLCGDAHVQNLGCFAAPDGSVVFDINDFDETIPGPWEWDVKRMAASIVLAGIESGHGGNSCAASAEAFLAAYCASIEKLADLPILVAARHQIRRARKVQVISAALQQAERATPPDLLKKYTEAGTRGEPRFKTINPILWRLKGTQRREVLEALRPYRESLGPEPLHLFDLFRPLDVAFKIVGTGSVGLRDFVVLMEGNGSRDPMFLQIKQEAASAYARYLTDVDFSHQGRRVVDGQRKLQAVSDLLLGWTRIGDHDFLVRQLNDHKSGIDLSRLRGEGLRSLAEIAGELIARGHARSGDALAIKGYIGSCSKVLKSLLKYALSYAELTQADFELFARAIKEGRIKVDGSKNG